MSQLSQISQKTVGWDVGGAHLKAVLVDADGTVLDAIQLACPLWRGLSFLEQATQSILKAWHAHDFFSAVTMTGELVDLFVDRAQGVKAIADCMHGMLGQSKLAFYVVDASESEGHFVTDVNQQPLSAASMNWHASVTYLAQSVAGAVVIDIGSTTTDICPLQSGKPLLSGLSDAERMQQHQLFYTGVVRTPLMAFGPYLQVNRGSYHLAAEYFATTADVYRLLDELPSAYDLADTADGQDKSLAATARRLARMIGRDLELEHHTEHLNHDSPCLHEWKTLAEGFKQQQLHWISQAVQHNTNTLSASAPLIGLGAGQFLVEGLAHVLKRPYLRVQSVITASSPACANHAALCFPAYAVARLWQSWQ